MIPVSEPRLEARDFELVEDVLRSGWISSAGKYLELFEERWAAFCGMPYGIAVSNGSVALDVAARLLDLQPGDEVILPAFTIISPAQSIVRAGGVPVLVDSDPAPGRWMSRRSKRGSRHARKPSWWSTSTDTPRTWIRSWSWRAAIDCS